MSICLRRREFIAALGGAAAWPLGASAQQLQKMRRIGVLMNRNAEDLATEREETMLQLRRSVFAACALAGVLVGIPRDGAEAESKSKANTTKPANPAVIECYKRAGMAINPNTKKWTMYSTENGGGIVRRAALRQCLASAKGVPASSITIREHLSSRYGGNPPRDKGRKPAP